MTDKKQELPPFSEIYKGFLIQYREYSNEWSIQRSESTTHNYPSLAKARESIDRLEKQEKKTFRRHAALLERYSRESFKPVEVTSYVVKSDFRGRAELHAWCKHADGSRVCEPVSKLRESCPANMERMAEIAKLEIEMEALSKRSLAISKEMNAYKKRTASDVFPSGEAPLDLLPFLS